MKNELARILQSVILAVKMLNRGDDVNEEWLNGLIKQAQEAENDTI